MILARSLLFACGLYFWTAGLSVLYLPLLLVPRRVLAVFVQLWLRGIAVIADRILGLRYELRGIENRLTGPAIYASKHQSAWETLFFRLFVPDCAFVLKRDLMWIPLWGWYVWRMGMIGIDRTTGVRSIKKMIAHAHGVLAAGRSIVVFPQGTRVAPGTEGAYLPGIAAIYGELGTSVVPVALNSGVFWPRRRFVKFPGIITVEFLKPIAPGLDRREFMALLEAQIEAASSRLEAEARRQLAATSLGGDIGSGGGETVSKSELE
jgi:1-acyl-sn-glycerol-3-phosphate acyltransferase